MRQPPDQIETLIVDFIRDELGETEIDDVGRDDSLLTSGLVDSVGIVRLIAHLEHRLGVTVPQTDLVPENFRTLRVMADYLRQRPPAGVGPTPGDDDRSR